MRTQKNGRPIVYQVFTRLFGNRVTANLPWGTKEQNGVGRFSDFTDTALQAIRGYGTTHLWYTGVPHHALIGHYSGISDDHPQVVKGRAGSPYAVKDYYNVNPDLADDPEQRLEEFRALIDRTHHHGMKVIIDIVPNHVARHYQSTSAPEGVRDFGADDDTQVDYARDNNFYYLPGEAFSPPATPDGFAPLGGKFQGAPYQEIPAKWTGNGARTAQPHWNDWFETVKINYGVRPDGSHDFPELPGEYAERPVQAHFDFWQDKDVPDSWTKFRDIALYWLDFGVDGFRFDMAELVPVEFWSYMNSAIKQHRPDAEVIAEVYQPDRYRDYLYRGKMDYLYDKVDVYDTLKAIVQERTDSRALDGEQAKLDDIDEHLLRFLENHDEQRIAHPEFAGSGERGWPAMIATALLGRGPVMLYFGQAQAERADQDLGFGKASRTTIFDYAGVPAHQAWMNNGRFDGGGLTPGQMDLDAAYQRLLTLAGEEPALLGEFISLHQDNLNPEDGYTERQYSFIRKHGDDWLLVFINFDFRDAFCTLTLPAERVQQLPGLTKGAILLEKIGESWLQVPVGWSDDGAATVPIHCPGFNGLVFKISN
ncbi:alpha-amylase family protein [Reinekea blandensis]|uniref:Glycosidase n=1 Tax=Reinekea blandensis MED297 TaxID=314283 RepID=A4BG17_9GAMM|nr:alpha-amylase family protein [Reinekea blandensis]EAR09035.1 Glycosidase [Reinekea sp. MED297] [Reinekea blandensis MED297]